MNQQKQERINQLEREIKQLGIFASQVKDRPNYLERVGEKLIQLNEEYHNLTGRYFHYWE